MNIVFYTNQISDRGTETAIIDYAEANEKILHNKSFISVPKDRIFDEKRYNYLKERYKFFTFSSIPELKKSLIENNIDLFYAIVSGSGKDITDELPEFKTFVHCVFSVSRRHGTYYCPIHQYLNIWGHTHYPVLPHITKTYNTTSLSLRKELGIPENAIVFGGYGGKDRFNIDFAQKAVIDAANAKKSLYFLFMNFDNFTTENSIINKNIFFLPGTTDLVFKEKFINTCTAMIHARSDGETFGLAVAEFSMKNKPVITYKPGFYSSFKRFIKWIMRKNDSYAMAHLMNLRDAAITYHDYSSLFDIFINFNKYYDKNKSYDRFSKVFTEEKVITIFNHIISR